MNMSPEYMSELHKFKYRSTDSDVARLTSIVSAHLKFIPRKKLYRYRKSTEIAPFTTRHDNRNMWENYAGNYTGFCVEYDFSRVLQNLTHKNSWDVLCLFPVKYYRKRPLFDYTNILHEIINADVNQGDFDIDVDDFFAQYYRAITAKLYDYRAEQEWRLVMTKDHLGEYEFPYAQKVYIGKDMPDDKIQRIQEIASKHSISVLQQEITADQNGFEYRRIL